MNYEEKTMKSEKIYEGKIVNLRIDTVELPDKKYSKREIVEHPGSVGIIPITDDSHIILVKQFRKPVEQNLLEIPAGKIEINEEPKETAFRELCEETGFVANKLEYLFEFYTSPGFSNEKMYLFVAKELVKREADPDDDEYIEVLKVKIEDSINMILRGEIVDSKTIIGILYAQQYLIGK
ncbi:ADP-ribose pyrophosphatase [Keratinibaculum paraultunense]|uniref:ADP-ribose pyrophosphatase n=1 Tax=Keratinibaculum paraultunense TaxID=1278232 RepID=A0A4R3L424_9FIRM|nr:NUDIX hydrolase [Keratinibaculum paraultunense]QQY80630.1 NUDIX hydrolase [Keratinibaculum paraultunense]TCS91363.1 ADP-ribose pyrophosphatase [Keratinibaculum paraultunense]